MNKTFLLLRFMVKGFILQITCVVYCFPQNVDFWGGTQLEGDNEIKSRMSWGPSVLPDTDSFIYHTM